MTTNPNIPHDSERFEDRLLATILEDFDALTAPSTAGPVRKPARRRPRSHTPARPRPVLAWAAPTLAVAGVAALVAFDHSGPAVSHGPSATHAAAPHHTTAPAVITARHRVLYRLAATTLSAPEIDGRYAILSETDTESSFPGVVVHRTSVDDTQTGASTTYQTGYGAESPGAPPVLTDGPEKDQTVSYFESLPTDPTALRAALLTAARQQWAAENAAMTTANQENAAKGIAVPASVAQGPTPSDDEFVYSQATDILWSPVVPPTLRSALYKVLAGCQDVTVNPEATDPSGRSSIEISQSSRSFGYEATYEDPGTGTVLAQVFGPGGSERDVEIYQPVTFANTIPPDPYGN